MEPAASVRIMTVCVSQEGEWNAYKQRKVESVKTQPYLFGFDKLYAFIKQVR